jgi:predicted enzyme related to lactoylglutathione lyase
VKLGLLLLYGRLRAVGVDVESIQRAEWGAAAHFFDPEGNELQVFETT